MKLCVEKLQVELSLTYFLFLVGDGWPDFSVWYKVLGLFLCPLVFILLRKIVIYKCKSFSLCGMPLPPTSQQFIISSPNLNRKNKTSQPSVPDALSQLPFQSKLDFKKCFPLELYSLQKYFVQCDLLSRFQFANGDCLFFFKDHYILKNLATTQWYRSFFKHLQLVGSQNRIQRKKKQCYSIIITSLKVDFRSKW